MPNEYKITQTEIEQLLIENLADKPNSNPSYGIGGQKPVDIKRMFDNQFKFLAEKYNILAAHIKEVAEDIEKYKNESEKFLDDAKTQLGDIEAALDEIIAMQEDLI